MGVQDRDGQTDRQKDTETDRDRDKESNKGKVNSLPNKCFNFFGVSCLLAFVFVFL